MVKAKELWTRLCTEFDYRFFTGIPFKAVTSIYRTMDSGIMHYVPAAHRDIAISLAAGARIAGFKSGIILAPEQIKMLNLSFCEKFSIPLLFITSIGPGTAPLKGFYTTKDLEKAVVRADKGLRPCILVLEGEDI